jgi:hypothetical protein
MLVRCLASVVCRRSMLRRVGAPAAALMLIATGPFQALAQEELRRDRRPEPVVFTVDVAEDLAGKFVPTMVKPEHTQPERGSFFVTEGRIFPAGTIGSRRPGHVRTSPRPRRASGA